MIHLRYVLVLTILAAGAPPAVADPTDQITLENVKEPGKISPDEPIAERFSLRNAAHCLDVASLSWQKKHSCGTCHTNFAYLMARPALRHLSPPSKEVRYGNVRSTK